MYETRGAGSPALVFVHGWSCDRSYWREQLTRFAGRHLVVAVDLGGHGESSLGRASWTMRAFGNDVVAVLDRLGVAAVVLIGHSMGGDVIVDAALRLGDRALGLVWVDTYTTLEDPLTDAEVVQFVTPFRADFVSATREFVKGLFLPGAAPELVARVAADMSSAPVEVALEAMQHSMANAVRMPGLLRSLDAPVVAINPADRVAGNDLLARHGVRTVLITGVGHFPMLEDAARFDALLADVIEQFARRRPNSVPLR